LSERISSALIVSAPSGAGKSTILGGAMAKLKEVRFSVSHTTRPPRGEERDGVEYHFVSPEAFAELVRADRFLEHATVHGHSYGTCWSELERAQSDGVDLMLDVDVQGAAQVRSRLPDVVSVFILPPSYEELEKRLRGRGLDDEATIRRRLEGAREEIDRVHEYDYAIVNDEVDRCIEALRCVIESARSRTSRVERVARSIAETFHEKRER
jgi:guanylate kinase